jgi:DNA-directed RNA polymerase specialized sigma subunit
MANNSKLSKRGGKRIVPKDMPHEYRKEYRELMRNEYITFRQEIENAIEKRKEIVYLSGYEFDHNISAFMPSWKQQDDIFQEWVKNGDMNLTLHRCLNKLTNRELIVIKKRFGIDGYEVLLLEEVARDIHSTRERIRQIEVKAIKKLKVFMRKLLPRDYWPKTCDYYDDYEEYKEYDDEFCD